MKLSVLFLYEFVKTSVLLVFCWLSCIKMQGQDIEIRGNVSLSGGTTDPLFIKEVYAWKNSSYFRWS